MIIGNLHNTSRRLFLNASQASKLVRIWSKFTTKRCKPVLTTCSSFSILRFQLSCRILYHEEHWNMLTETRFEDLRSAMSIRKQNVQNSPSPRPPNPIASPMRGTAPCPWSATVPVPGRFFEPTIACWKGKNISINFHKSTNVNEAYWRFTPKA